jgi:hypothetical protein
MPHGKAPAVQAVATVSAAMENSLPLKTATFDEL